MYNLSWGPETEASCICYVLLNRSHLKVIKVVRRAVPRNHFKRCLFYLYIYYLRIYLGARGSVMVKALCYILEGREFDTR
jgi:hypothetical protein